MKDHGIPPNPFNPHAWITGNPKIGKGTWIGAFCLIDGLGGLEIGKACDISCGAHIVTHSTVRRCISGRRHNKIDFARTKIGHNVFIGENATILKGVEIGHHSVIGAGAVVTENTKIPAYSLVVGIPARVVRSLREEVSAFKNGKRHKKTKRK
ncbi:MAG: acyltransferase [Candidatus Omnitrophica bacterium]|nr:acyltransferase [Candidatus Omnitrophota bacterium]